MIGNVVFVLLIVGFVVMPIVALVLLYNKRKRRAAEAEHHRAHGHHRPGR